MKNNFRKKQKNFLNSTELLFVPKKGAKIGFDNFNKTKPMYAKGNRHLGLLNKEVAGKYNESSSSIDLKIKLFYSREKWTLSAFKRLPKEVSQRLMKFLFFIE